jgi:glycosyltransferase involved in cell wall biosynthesis
MKICIDATRGVIENAGIARYTNKLLQCIALMDRKNSYRLIYTYGRKSVDKEKKIIKQAGQFSKVQHNIFHIPGSLKEHIWNIKYFPSKWLYADCDIFHAPSYMELPYFIKLPSVLTIHDMTTFLFPQQRGLKISRFHNQKVVRACDQASKIICISDSTKQDLIKICKIDENKVITIPLAADEKFVTNTNVKRKNYILTVGTIEPRKNLQKLISAYARLPFKIRQKHHLVVVGGKGWNDTEIYKSASELIKLGQVVFTGFVDDDQLIRYYQQALFFIYASKYEGFGLPVLEAMSCSTPVITSDCSSLAEIAQDSAVLVSPNSVSDIYQAMYQLIKNPKTRLDLSYRGYKRSRLYSWQKTARKTLEIYNNLRAKTS